MSKLTDKIEALERSTISVHDARLVREILADVWELERSAREAYDAGYHAGARDCNAIDALDAEKE